MMQTENKIQYPENSEVVRLKGVLRQAESEMKKAMEEMKVARLSVNDGYEKFFNSLKVIAETLPQLEAELHMPLI